MAEKPANPVVQRIAMPTNTSPLPAEGRRTPVLQLRAALTIAEGAASKLCDEATPDVQTQAQALLHRLAAIRAEIDLLEQLASPRSRRTAQTPCGSSPPPANSAMKPAIRGASHPPVARKPRLRKVGFP